MKKSLLKRWSCLAPDLFLTHYFSSVIILEVCRNGFNNCSHQCCGWHYMTFLCGSGSADPCLWLMDPDPDPGSGSCFFRHWPSRCSQKNNFCLNIFSAYYFLKVHLHHFSKIKSQKELQNSRNRGFSYYFCTMIEGSESGSITLTNGSGSERPKNMWIRIHNTGYHLIFASGSGTSALFWTQLRPSRTSFFQ